MQDIFEKIKDGLKEKSFVDYEEYYKDGGECLISISDAIEIVNQVAEEYEKDIVGGSKKPKYVSIGAYKQVAWERDIAIEQLHELGYDFGQKIDVPDKNIGETDGWIPCSGCYDCNHTECERYGKI